MWRYICLVIAGTVATSWGLAALGHPHSAARPYFTAVAVAAVLAVIMLSAGIWRSERSGQ